MERDKFDIGGRQWVEDQVVADYYSCGNMSIQRRDFK